MQIKSAKKLLAAAALAGLTFSGYRLAAQNPADNGGGAPQPAQGRRGGPGGGFGNFDPSQLTDMMVENYHETLQPTDDEWAVIKPLLTNVVKLQMTQTRPPMGMMGGRRGGPGGGFGGPGGPGMQGDQGGPGGPNGQGGPGGPGGGFGGLGGPGGRGGFGAMFGETDPTQQALSDAVNTETPSADAVKAKLEAYRAAQAKKAAELKTAREKLRAVLSIIQEAKLVLSGVLD